MHWREWRGERCATHVLRTLLGVLAVAAVSISLTACGSGSEEPKGEVVITCASCQNDPNDAAVKYHYEAVQRFNKTFAGRYRVKVLTSHFESGAERLQRYQREALANDLADVFLVNPSELASLQKTGKLMDFTPALEDDADWKDSYYDGALDALRREGDKTFAVPETRDALGIFYNKAIFADAGVREFPQTWDELNAACAKIEASGKTCFAMDGDWVTLLWWVNLIGTQDGGADFLTSGIGEGDYASNPIVIRATETLKRWHTEGYVNKDAFTGEYPNAATAFVRGQAAMIANGPWMIPYDIKSENAIKGLYDQLGYEPSPGWTADGRGLIVVAGEGSWASGATDERKQEAVLAFMKYLTTHDERVQMLVVTNSGSATKLELSDAEKRKAIPLTADLLERSTSIPFTYPHAFVASAAGFETAWTNLWPAYVSGDLSTDEFLGKLGEDATSPTG